MKTKMKNFRNVALIGRKDVVGVPETLMAVCDFLTQHGVNFVVDDETSHFFNSRKVEVITREDLPKCSDLIIVVGGDGSILNIAPFAAKHNLPVFGINRGQLGFLTDIHPDAIYKIAAILDGHYQEEQRFLLNLRVKDENNRLVVSDTALNDVVISAHQPTKLVEFVLNIDKEYVCDYRADGLIVSTPTGSTAYALSAGGPILHPNLDAITLLPMFSHNLSSRPIVIEGKNKISVVISKDNRTNLCVNCDGRQSVDIPLGSVVEITQEKFKLLLIHPEEYNYFATLRSKLHWEQ